MKLIMILISALIILNGCAPAREIPNDESASTNLSDNEETELLPNSPAVVYASEWSEISFISNFAKTSVGVGAHFTTSRNACGKDAYGAISLQAWNALATQANYLALNPPNGPDYCVPIPDNNIYLGRAGLSAEIKTDRGKFVLYENMGNEICSKIQDHLVSDHLLQAMSQVIEAADKEDCANGWGN